MYYWSICITCNVPYCIFSGKCYFKGPWLLMPTEVPHTPTKLFYKQELFLSTVDGTHPIVAIVGKCAVLDYGEYICSECPLFHRLMSLNE